MAELHAWLETACCGDVAVYHVGDLLLDRQADAQLDQLAASVLFRSPVEALIAPSACGHARWGWRGSGELAPLQWRIGPGRWAYVAAKL